MSFPLPPLPKRRDQDYEIGELLGRGNFVTVFSAVEIPTGRNVALKVVDRYRATKLKKTADLEMEKHILRRTNHPNIIKMLAHFTDTLTVYVVLEECKGGELWDFVKTVGCDDRTAKHFIAQLMNAVEYMRQANIVHRDLKAENCMLAERGVLKVIDFGTAKDIENYPRIKGSGNVSRQKVFEHYVGTPQFMAPEVIENKSADFRSDTWSLGCTFYQILAGVPPFHAASEYLVFCKIMDMALNVPPGVDLRAKDLIERMVVKSPDIRLGAFDLRDVKEHAYLSDVVYENAYKKPQPVPSLFDCCIRVMGKKYKEFEGLIAAFPKKDQFSKSTLDVFERLRLARQIYDDALPPEEQF